MNKISVLVFMGVFAFVTSGCKKSPSVSIETTDKAESEVCSDIFGDYVSFDYELRNEGADWISVQVTDSGDNKLGVTVRSRADIKKPTCTFDGIAQKTSDSTYIVPLDDKNMLLTFREGLVSISTESPEDADELYFYCSGGATLAGSYTKISEVLD